MSSAPSMLRLRIRLPQAHLELLEEGLWQRGALAIDVASLEANETRITVLFPSAHSRETEQRVAAWLAEVTEGVSQVQWDMVDTGDWRAKRREAFTGRQIGRFWLLPPKEEILEALSPSTLVMRIFADHAFGTGDHATTALMLEAMQNYDLANKQILDVGTGTGVLALAAEKLGAEKCHGFDNDPDCLANMEQHLSMNEAQNTRLWIGGFDSVAALGYDWVLANVTLNVHRELAACVAQWGHKQTKILGSGILAEQWEETVLSYQTNGWELRVLAQDGAWLCFLGWRS